MRLTSVILLAKVAGVGVRGGDVSARRNCFFDVLTHGETLNIPRQKQFRRRRYPLSPAIFGDFRSLESHEKISLVTFNYRKATNNSPPLASGDRVASRRAPPSQSPAVTALPKGEPSCRPATARCGERRAPQFPCAAGDPEFVNTPRNAISTGGLTNLFLCAIIFHNTEQMFVLRPKRRERFSLPPVCGFFKDRKRTYVR